MAVNVCIGIAIDSIVRIIICKRTFSMGVRLSIVTRRIVMIMAIAVLRQIKFSSLKWQ